jgi:hypothetical protein
MFYEHGWAAVIKIAFRRGPCQLLAHKTPQFSVNIGKDGPGSSAMTKKDGPTGRLQSISDACHGRHADGRPLKPCGSTSAQGGKSKGGQSEPFLPCAS